MLTQHMHVCNKICHRYTYSIVGDLPDDGHAKAETCSKQTLEWQTIVFVDCEIFGLNAAWNMENIKIIVMLSVSLLVVRTSTHG